VKPLRTRREDVARKNQPQLWQRGNYERYMKLSTYYATSEKRAYTLCAFPLRGYIKKYLPEEGDNNGCIKNVEVREFQDGS
jgi:hypothetical protein